MKVGLILEDPTLDAHIAVPVIERLFAELGKTARVRAVRDPHLSGAAEALDPQILARVIELNPMEQLFVLIVDRDCDRQKHSQRASARERELAPRLIACVAVEELETWLLALHAKTLGQSWKTVRAECDPKEHIAEPFLERQGWRGGVGKGRKEAMRALGSTWAALNRRCPELRELQKRIAALP